MWRGAVGRRWIKTSAHIPALTCMTFAQGQQTFPVKGQLRGASSVAALGSVPQRPLLLS